MAWTGGRSVSADMMVVHNMYEHEHEHEWGLDEEMGEREHQQLCVTQRLPTKIYVTLDARGK